MSHIPNSAMPHAGGTQELEREEGMSLRDRASSLMESARAHPKTSAAAGAALVAGVAAAAAAPFMLRGRSKSSGSSSGRSKKSK